MKSTGYNIAIIAVLLMVVAPIAKASEPSAVYKALLVKYDANKDGRLDTAEREIIRTDRLRPQSRERSPRRQFRYPDEGVARFDRNDDNELEGEEFDAARQWGDKRFKEINAEYDADKDGRLNTAERAALSKQIEGGKFKDIGWLTRYLCLLYTSPSPRDRG